MRQGVRQKRANEAHRNCTAICSLALPLGSQSVERVGKGASYRRPKSDFRGIKCREKLNGIRRMCVVRVADAGQQAKESGVEMTAQHSQLPQHSLQITREDSVRHKRTTTE
jgi:hypothetical protein